MSTLLTRQELTDIIRVNKIKTFDELLESHGQGLAVPFVSLRWRILASYWNDYILKDETHRAARQQRHLPGNMQKDGTYSCGSTYVGGEITPRQTDRAR
ncbi:hypothetical protein OK016_21010 [Vibrio chagasii]|nr:hypothetical protein [Vibrio chagasii]